LFIIPKKKTKKNVPFQNKFFKELKCTVFSEFFPYVPSC
jgi:hypothetical protein